LFEEFIKSRKMLVTSQKKITSATNPSPGEGTYWCLLQRLNELPRRGQRLHRFNGTNGNLV
jgi:hypothetical protein